jgi:magnesium-transporting ATPase (P-type)
MLNAGAILDDPSTTPADDVAQALGTDLRHGLTSDEAARRLARDGANALRATPGVPAWRKLLSHFQDPLVYLLLVALAIALAAWLMAGAQGWPVDALVIAAVVLLNGALGYMQEARAADAVAALARLTEMNSTVVRGDLLLLAEGDAVGADARLVQAAALRAHEASLTGESGAVLKDAATLAQLAALGDQRNMVFKGSTIAQGTARAVVTATGMATQVGLIAHLLEATAEKPTPLQDEVASIGRRLGVAVVAIAVVVVGTLLLLSNIRNMADAVAVLLLLGVALAVAAVPEGLPAILSIVLALGVRRMARSHAIVKKLSSVETLGCATVICSDKTGTLTRSEMTIERVVSASGSTRVTGAGYAPVGRFEHNGAELAPGPLRDEHIVVLSGASMAGNAGLRQAADGEWEIHGDPTEAAFLVAERKLGATERRERRFERVGEIPFTSERKMMSTLEIDHERGGQVVLITKGAPDVLHARCTRVRVGAAEVALDATRRAAFLAEVEALAGAALRTLAVAYRPLAPGEHTPGAPPAALERDLIFVGVVGIIDPPRPEAAAAIREAQRAGIRVIMITGDHPRTAARIAADLGIVPPGASALTGLDIDALDDAGLQRAVRDTSVYARVAPAHKLRIVSALQAQGNVVAMTGDGVNDAPALKAADIGVAMGVTGTEVAKQAARMVLADDNFATIVLAVREGRAIVDNIRKFLRYLLCSNMGEVLTVFLGVGGGRRDRAQGRRRRGGAAAAGHAAAVDQPHHRLRARAGHGGGPARRRPDGQPAAPPGRAHHQRRDVGGRGADRPGDCRGHAADHGPVPSGRPDRRRGRPRHRPHGRLYRAGVRQPVHLPERALGNCQRLPPPVRQPVAVGGAGAVAAAAGGGGAPSCAQPRLRHRAAGAGPVAGVRGHGQRRAVVQRAAQAGAAFNGPLRRRPASPAGCATRP